MGVQYEKKNAGDIFFAMPGNNIYVIYTMYQRKRLFENFSKGI